ncbi:MAG: hypothetical protein ISQ07_00460 [Pirellulales bacterium]|jgi:hypothetical protein|nr:hypothetical protein [Pirellulales bacterium]
MDKKLFVVAIAVGAGLSGTLIPLLMQREGQPRLSRPVLWGLLAAGVVAFLSVLAVRIARGGG